MINRKVMFLLFISAVLYASGDKEIKPSKKIKIAVREPSGLAYLHDEDCFLVVSDEYPAVYKINRKGEVLREIKIDGYDLEGVAAADDGTIFVVDEKAREVISVDPEGNELSRFDIEIKSPLNSGPEGICIDTDNKHLYIVNEKNPGMILVYDFYGNRVKEYTPGLASDYSGICYDRSSKMFYILSDEESSVFFWTPASGLSKKYKIAADNPEGIVIGNDGNIYVVSDKKELIYVFKQGKEGKK